MNRLTLASIRQAVIVAPHPDDETIGAWALMRALRRMRVGVRVIVVSDGAASHQASPTWPRARLIRERQRETRRALWRIGIAAGAIRFLGLADGALDADATTGNRLRRALARSPKTAVIVAPDRGDDHPDHRAVARGVAHAGGSRRQLAYRVWTASSRRPLPDHAGLTVRHGGFVKRAAIARYRTQAGAIRDDPHGFAMTRAQIAGFARPLERFVRVR